MSQPPATTRHRIDAAFAAWGRQVHRRPRRVLALTLSALAACAATLPHIRAENSVESFLRGTDHASLVYEAFRREFGQDSMILLAVEAPDVFAPDFLARLQALHRDLEADVPHVREITSLVNARETRGVGDTLVVGELFERWREDGAEPEELRRRVFANPLHVDNLVARDARLTTITIEPSVYTSALEPGDVLGGFDAEGPQSDAEPPLLTEPERRELVQAIRAVVGRHAGSGFRVHPVGSMVLATQLTERMADDAARHLSVAAAVIVLILYALFRRFSGVLMPMAVVVAALTANLATMVWSEIPFSITLSMLPVFTMCVGVCAAVHVLVPFYRQLGRGAPREEALAGALGHSGLAILLTSLTTAAGMLSFVTATVDPIRHLGLTAPFGVLYAFLFSMTLLPALIALFPPRREVRWQRRGSPWTEALLVRTGDLATRRPGALVAGALLVTAASALGAAQVRFAHDPVSWFPEDDPTRRAIELVDRELRGASSTEVRVATGENDGLYRPERLRRIDAAARAAEAFERRGIAVGKAISLADIVKETNQALHANDPAHYTIPGDRRMVAQELLLFENSGSDDMEPFVDSRFSTTRITFKVPMVDAVHYRAFLDDLEQLLARELGDVAFSLTGQTVIQARTLTALVESMARSYAIALLVITPLMVVLIRDLRLGLISMVPNLLPVLVTLGVMGFLGIPLDTSTIMIGTMIIGLAVDDTIHFLHRYRRELASAGDVGLAVRETMVTTGSALFFTSLVLVTGFAVLGSLGTLHNAVHFGFLSAFGIAVAFVADAVFTPALIALASRGAWGRGNGR